jgi:hypothetical protein
MEPREFDRLTVSLSKRLSRRNAMALGAAAIAGPGLMDAGPALAQEATPEPSVDPDSTPGFIYVQLAESGTWTPKPDEEGVFQLALYGTGEQTLYFATGSDRIAGVMPTDQFLDELGFTPANPPNAAVEVWTADGERDVLVVQLIDPVYSRTFGDDAEETLTYDAKVLSAYTGERLTEWLPDVGDDQFPVEFTNVSLFIDYGCVVLSTCNRDDENGTRVPIGPYPQGRVRQFPDAVGRCSPCCGATIQLLIENCNSYYPACQGGCYPT